jgi:hypothetical protein
MPVEINVRSDLKDLTTALESVFSERRLNSVIASTLTAVAKECKVALTNEAENVFESPTPWVLNGTFFTAANAQNLTALVGWKDEGAIASGKGVPAGKSLLAEIYGGKRADKRFEKALQYAGALPQGYQVTPGVDARLDQYGNMSAGQIVQILSALKAFSNVGYSANRTNVSAKKKGAKLAQYFVVRPGDASHLGLGIYQRTGAGIRKLMNFIKPPSYRIRLPEEKIVQQTIDARLEDIFVHYALASLERLKASKAA